MGQIDDAFEFDELMQYTGCNQWNAVYTITIGELVENGVFDWKRPELDWSKAAYNEEQYKRVCDYFIQRFMYREISIEPFLEWAVILKRKLVFELMPKYKFLYAEIDKDIKMDFSGRENFNGKKNDDNYYKRREIESQYPETQLSGNSDYITNGNDLEDQRLIEHTEEYDKTKTAPAREYLENVQKYLELMTQVDKKLLDELESMFVCMYTANVNATW